MARLGRIYSEEGEYFEYRRPSKFISEILIALSSIVGVSSIGVLIGLGSQLKYMENDEHGSMDKAFAIFIYTIVILIVCISDIIFSLFLHNGVQKLKLSYCLFWRGATITSLIVVGMLTLAFVTMVHDLILMLGYLPSLFSKPFSLWVVSAFIQELAELRTFPTTSTGASILPSRPSFSMDDPESIKRSTTVFHLKKNFGGTRNKSPYIITSKLRSIPEQ
ncbi:hypothetical protein Ocin01_17228 [Orchesella cincta]|uniref:Uncharacterized protein n=1 Tax=Orchesella cincta TaxID=48709 RepID=A0A1D2M967_ORCCI|nr:hypothetical protein Ocin01_17228 [Orchesella cincta]